MLWQTVQFLVHAERRSRRWTVHMELAAGTATQLSTIILTSSIHHHHHRVDENSDVIENAILLYPR